MYVQFDYTLNESADLPRDPWYVENNLFGNPITNISSTQGLMKFSLTYSIPAGDTVTYNYNMPASNFVYANPSDIRLRNYLYQPVTNSALGPVVGQAIVTANQHNAVAIHFKSILSSTSSVSAGNFSVAVTKDGVTSQVGVSSLTIASTTVTLTILRTVMYGETVTCGYTRPAVGGLQDSEGNLAGSFSDQAVTNHVLPDTTAPILRSKFVPGNQANALQLVFNEFIDSTNIASPAHFTITVASSASTATQVDVAGTVVVVGHGTTVANGQSVTIAYTNPLTAGILQGSGNDATHAKLSLGSGTATVGASTKYITGITNANPGVVTSADHGFADGNVVSFANINGMIGLHGNTYKV
jgi:uncharacterized repeat protein (TIGR02059 family)